jgi:hypothetical protein
MLTNVLCPYCSVQLIKAENQPNSRSVEHLVPNTVLRTKRKNDEGDFFACRRCNSRKSHIDYVLGVVVKSQSRDPEFAAAALTRAIDKEGGSSERFVQMIAQAKPGIDEVLMDIPISGNELLEYVHFLGKGQYFRKRRRIFDASSQVMLVLFASKQVHASIESSYELEHGTNPFRDLELNAGAEVLSQGDCIIWSKNDSYLFVFHDYTSIGIRIKRRNRKNTEREQLRDAEILDDFSSSPSAAAT